MPLCASCTPGELNTQLPPRAACPSMLASHTCARARARAGVLRSSVGMRVYKVKQQTARYLPKPGSPPPPAPPLQGGFGPTPTMNSRPSSRTPSSRRPARTPRALFRYTLKKLGPFPVIFVICWVRGHTAHRARQEPRHRSRVVLTTMVWPLALARRCSPPHDACTSALRLCLPD